MLLYILILLLPRINVTAIFNNLWPWVIWISEIETRTRKHAKEVLRDLKNYTTSSKAVDNLEEINFFSVVNSNTWAPCSDISGVWWFQQSYFIVWDFLCVNLRISIVLLPEQSWIWHVSVHASCKLNCLPTRFNNQLYKALQSLDYCTKEAVHDSCKIYVSVCIFTYYNVRNHS